jgi:hypothetical protein
MSFFTNAAAPRLSTGTVDTQASDPYWHEDGWVPRTKAGKQRTPNMIRNELQKHIDTCGETQTAVIQQLGVNSNSFRKFMNPKTYKDQWSAVQNGTYWAAARLLEAHRNMPKKRKEAPAASAATTTAAGTAAEGNAAKKAKTSTSSKQDMIALMVQVYNYPAPGVSDSVIYDSCPELVAKIKAFLARDGVTKADFCGLALAGANANSLNKFLSAKKQDGRSNMTYKRAWVFFEKMRLMDGTPKSNARVKNELEQPSGFSTNRPSTGKWVLAAARSMH